MTSPTQISDEELRALAERATRGPWKHVVIKRKDGSEHDMIAIDDPDPHDCLVVAHISCDGDNDEEYLAAVSPDRILGLLDRLEKAEKRAARYEETLRWISNGGHWNDGLKSVQEYARQALSDDSEASRDVAHAPCRPTAPEGEKK